MKQNLLFLVILLYALVPNLIFCQTNDPDVLLKKKEQLEYDIKDIDRSIKNLNTEKRDYQNVINRINDKLFEIGFYKDDKIWMYAKYIHAPLKVKPSFDSDVLTNIPQGDSAIFIQNNGPSYVKVEYKGYRGYVTSGVLVLKKGTVLPSNNKPKEVEPKSLVSTFLKDLGVDKKEDISCGSISKSVDKFTDEVSFHSPKISGIDLHKYITSEHKYSYAIYIRIGGFTPIAWEKGAYLLFEDGQKIHFPGAKIESEVATNNDFHDYEYRSFIPITKSQMTTFSKNTITDVRLYVFDSHLSVDEAMKIKFYASCLLNQSN